MKRAVPRTDVPPARSVSSRAGSFSGTTGPGSVCSLEDVSVSSTATTAHSMPGTPSRTNGSSSSSRPLSSPPTNLMANGTLVGYAAAVRYGGRGIPKPSATPVPPPSAAADLTNGVSDENLPTDGVADALSSLAIGESSTTPSLSASSSLESPSKLLESARNGHFSPLESAMSPLADPVIEQWNLSPAAPPQPSASSEVPFLGQSESSYLSGAIGDDDTDESQLSWQAAPWEQSWPSLQQQNQAPESSQRSPSSPSFFPMFSTQGMTSSGSPMSESAWSPPEYTSRNGNSLSNGFGNGMMGMGSGGLPMSNGFGSNGSGGRGAFGSGGLGMRGGSPYSALGGFLQPEYMPQQEPELPLDTGFGSIIGDSGLGPDGELEKKQHLDFALPSSPTGFQRHYR